MSRQQIEQRMAKKVCARASAAARPINTGLIRYQSRSKVEVVTSPDWSKTVDTSIACSPWTLKEHRAARPADGGGP